MLKNFLKKFKTDPISEPLVLQNKIGQKLIYDLKAVGGGEYVLPSDHLSISILAPESAQKSLLDAAFGGGKLEDFLVQKLAEEKCRQTISVRVDFIGKPKKHWNGDQIFEINYRTDDEAQAIPAVTIRIINGKATRRQFKLIKETINLGRTAEAFDKYGTLIRKNDVVFEDIAEEPNNYVSKIHAQITYSRAENVFYLSDSGYEYGLVTNGTMLFREGSLVAKLNANQKVSLQNGDEIHLGKASVRFETKG